MKNKNKFKIIIIVMFMITITGLVTYGAFYTINSQSSTNMISSSCFSTAFTDTQSINLTNAYSMTDEDGLKTTPYTFTITNTCNLGAKFYVIVSIKDGSFSGEYINYSSDGFSAYKLSDATQNTEYVNTGYSSSYIIEDGTLNTNGSKTYDIRLWINESTTYEDVKGKNFEAEIKVVSSLADLAPSPSATTLAHLGLTSSSDTPDFSTVATTDETANGLFSMEDDYGTSYYFRGDVTNNYVKFGKYADIVWAYFVDSNYSQYPMWEGSCPSGDDACLSSLTHNTEIYMKDKDMYWRIIRINGDGSLRLIYDGTSPHENGEQSYDRFVPVVIGGHGSTYFNKYTSGEGANAYFGYMYGTPNASSYEEEHENINSSTIKTYLDSWYETNFENTKYEKYISDEIFCNDRSIYDSSVTNTSTSYYNSNMVKLLTSQITTSTGDTTTTSGVINQVPIDSTPDTPETPDDNGTGDNTDTPGTGTETPSEPETPNTPSTGDSTNTDTPTTTIPNNAGYGTSQTQYGAYGRLIINTSPQLKCPQQSDSFTVSDTNLGNGALSKPVGLITADELAIVGNKFNNSNANTFLYNPYYGYWTMTPLGDLGLIDMFVLNDNYLFYMDSKSIEYMYPVINLSAEAAQSLIGTGVIGDEYRLPNE